MSNALDIANACVPSAESELPIMPHARAVLVGVATDRIQAALDEARRKAIEDAAQAAKNAYAEHWRLTNEHNQRYMPWRLGRKVGEMPTINIGSIPDFIAARIRALLSESKS